MPDSYQAPASAAARNDPPQRSRFWLFLSLFMTCLTALVLSFAVPQFQNIIAGFGADIPWFTSIVVNGYLAAWLLPACAATAWLYWPVASHRHLISVAIGLGGLLLLLPLCIAALYLPVFKLATSDSGGLALLPFILLFAAFVAGVAFWFWALIDCLTKEKSTGNEKIVWLLVIFALNIIGALAYFIVRRPQRKLEAIRTG